MAGDRLDDPTGTRQLRSAPTALIDARPIGHGEGLQSALPADDEGHGHLPGAPGLSAAGAGAPSLINRQLNKTLSNTLDLLLVRPSWARVARTLLPAIFASWPRPGPDRHVRFKLPRLSSPVNACDLSHRGPSCPRPYRPEARGVGLQGPRTSGSRTLTDEEMSQPVLSCPEVNGASRRQRRRWTQKALTRALAGG